MSFSHALRIVQMEAGSWDKLPGSLAPLFVSHVVKTNVHVKHSLPSVCFFFNSFACVYVCVSAGQVMTAGIAEILNGYSLKAILRQVPGEKQTVAAEDANDDSYLGNTQEGTPQLMQKP